MLVDTIKVQIKEAMVAKDSIRLNTLRGILAGFTNELVAKKRKPTEILSDEEAISVISKLVKQRKDSIDQFKKGGREDLVKEEEAELAILSVFVPAQMSRDEIVKIAQAKKDELGVTDPPAGEAGKSKQGILMSALMKELKGKADGNLVKEIVESLSG